MPIGGKLVELEAEINRVECRKCGCVRQEKIEFAAPKCQHTRFFERYALELLRHMTIKDVAAHLGVSWDVIKDMNKRYLKKKFGRPRLKDVKLIAIDEISVGNGHKYFTVVLDLAKGACLFVGEGKGEDALKPFWKKLKVSGAKIAAVAMDMSPAFIAAAVKNLPNAKIVFDHFHVVKMLNDKLSDLRRELHSNAKDKLHKDVLKGTRWLLLKNPENLNDKRDERKHLDEALSLNQPLATAYYLKEDLRRLWKQLCKSDANKFLSDWIARAEVSGISIMVKFARTLASHRSGIIAYYDYPISTGPLEGVNNKIKTMKRQAYGFRDKEFFMLKILGLHESKYALVG